MNEPTRRPKNWLLIKIREWHTWLGVALSGFVVLVCATGIYLNHKDLFKPAEEKPEPPQMAGKPEQPKGPPTVGSADELAQLPIGFDRVLRLAREQWGDTALERVELKAEKGQVVYKVKAGPGRELIIDAQSGALAAKEGHHEEHRGPDGARTGGGINWGKLMMDLHTGKLVGGPGKLLVDLTSFTIIVLTLTGVYLWAVPLWRKRQSARERAAAAGRQRVADPQTLSV
jgi:hypothetical protein